MSVPLQPEHRLSVLLSDSGGRWVEQLPRLLEPQGVRSIRVASVDQAVRAIESNPIHAAVVDLAMPMDGLAAGPVTPERSGGLKLLRVIHRLVPRPPTVVVRGRLFAGRDDDRVLAEALKLEAFTVLDQPVELEQLLGVLRRVLERYYEGHWPA